MPTGAEVHRSRNRLLVAAGGILLAAIAYRRYRKELSTRWVFFQALNDTLESWRSLAACSRVVLRQATDYIEGKTAQEECPPTLDRLAGLASQPEAVSAVSALVQGAFARPGNPSFLDRILEVAVSERGQQLIGMSTTNAVRALCTALLTLPGSDSQVSQVVERVLEWASSPVGQAATSRSVAAFVSAGVTAYSDSTASINSVDRIMATLAKPQHMKCAQKLVSTFCSSGVNAVANNWRKSSGVRVAGARPALQPLSKKGTAVCLAQENMHSAVKEVHQGEHASGQGALTVLLADEIVRACHSTEVRATCAAMARAGCSGAMDSALTHLRDVSSAVLLPQSELSRFMMTILFTWLLLVPLWLLHCSVMVPAQATVM